MKTISLRATSAMPAWILSPTSITSPSSSAGRPHGGDYDGNGVTEGVQTEVDGVLTNLVNKMLATGMTRGTGGSAWTNYTNAVASPVI